MRTTAKKVHENNNSNKNETEKQHWYGCDVCIRCVGAL